MLKHEDNAVTPVGGVLRQLAGISITVTDKVTGLPASLYKDDEITPIAQPLTTDNNGYYGFKAPDGTYLLTFSGQRIATFTREITLDDPKDNPYATVAGLAAGQGAAGIGFGNRTVADKLGDVLHARDMGVKGDGVTDDYPAFAQAVGYARTLNKPLDISDLKIYLGTQNASISLDGVMVIGNGYLPKPIEDIAYLNGADHAVAIWDSIRGGQGSGVFSRYAGAITTGKSFNIQNATVVCDYNSPGCNAYWQSTPTTYPGWSQPLKDTRVAVYYPNGNGIHLVGGLELCNLREVSVWFAGGWPLYIGMTPGVNCPIEYDHFDKSCSFICGKLGNVWLDGFRRHVTFDTLLLNEPGQYAAQKVANPSFSVASQSDIVPALRVTGLAAGVYGDEAHGGAVNHSGSDHLFVNGCYAEGAQNIVQIDGAPINSVEITNNHLLPWDNAQPRNIPSIKGVVYRMRTYGNTNIDGTFPIYIDPSVVSNAADYLIEEATVAGGVSFVGAKPLDPALTPAPGWRQQSGTLGDGTAGTFTYNVDVHQIPPVNTATVTSLWEISANFQDTQFDRSESVLMFVRRHSSGNYTGQLLNQPPTAQVFSSAPSITTAGVLQIPLTLYSRARVTRIDMQPLRIA